jgi:hypothetical protein
MNYPVLIAELAADPLGRGYAGMTNQEAAANLTATLPPHARTVPDSTRRTFRDLCRIAGVDQAGNIYAKLAAVADSNPGVALAIAAAGDYAADGGLDFSDAATVAAIEGLLIAAALTEAEGNTLKALGQQTVSRARELGLGTVTDGHIGSARLKMGA